MQWANAVARSNSRLSTACRQSGIVGIYLYEGVQLVILPVDLC
jgi:hypothetical protein